jgi:hypothetical protein
VCVCVCIHAYVYVCNTTYTCKQKHTQRYRLMHTCTYSHAHVTGPANARLTAHPHAASKTPHHRSSQLGAAWRQFHQSRARYGLESAGQPAHDGSQDESSTRQSPRHRTCAAACRSSSLAAKLEPKRRCSASFATAAGHEPDCRQPPSAAN